MKWFTVATGGRYSRWHGASRARADSAVLVFGTDDESRVELDDLEKIAQDLEVRALFGDAPFVVQYFDGSILAHQQLNCLNDPDGWKMDDAPDLVVEGNGHVQRYDGRTRYENCTSLLRAVGCSKCPELGRVCMLRSLPELPELHSTVEWEETFEKFAGQHAKKQIAGYTYASPSMTKDDSRRSNFESSARAFDEHHFSEIERWHKQRSDASKLAGERRRFKQAQCAKCSLKDRCHDLRYRYCEGAFPSAKEMTEQVLAEWLPRLKNDKNFSYKELLTIMRWGAEERRFRSGIVVPAGIQWSSKESFYVPIIRARRYIREKDAIYEYARLVNEFHFPLNPDPPAADEQALALYCASLAERHTKNTSGGWGSNSRALTVRELTSTGVQLYWNCKRMYWAGPRIDNWLDYYVYLHDPPVEQEHGREKQHGYYARF